jgi:hypothetical protein
MNLGRELLLLVLLRVLMLLVVLLLAHIRRASVLVSWLRLWTVLVLLKVLLQRRHLTLKNRIRQT